MKRHVPCGFVIKIRLTVLICLIWWLCGRFICSFYAGSNIVLSVCSSESGPEDCETTVNLISINNTIIYVNASLNTVCFECDYSHFFGLIHEVVFRVNDTVVTSNSTLGRVVEKFPHNYIDTLVVNDRDSVFSTFSDTNIQCCEAFAESRRHLCHGNYFMANVGVLLFKGM